MRERAARFEERYGRAPSQRELAQLAQASNFATRKGKEGALDLAQAHAGWADRLARTLGVPLASVAPSVWHADAHRAGAAGHAQDADAGARPRGPAGPGTGAAGKVRVDPGKPGQAPGPDPAPHRAEPGSRGQALEETAERILRSKFNPVLCLEAPNPVDLPANLVRADGRSVYRRHGGTRYATRAQLSMEERMAAQAQAVTAPRMTREAAAHALGADPARLERALAGDAETGAGTGSGLREDQAAAALSVLTDGRRVSVINAPPARARRGSWPRSQERGGRQASARSSGSPRPSRPATPWPRAGSSPTTSPGSSATSPANAARRGHWPIAEGTLLAVDEASMMTSPDLADLIDLAERHGGKVIVAGDTEQLQAIQNGGGMSLLADRLGYVRLAEPVRFRAAWERPPACGCATATPPSPDEYDRHGRITGGRPGAGDGGRRRPTTRPWPRTAPTRCSSRPTTPCAGNCPAASARTCSASASSTAPRR